MNKFQYECAEPENGEIDPWCSKDLMWLDDMGCWADPEADSPVCDAEQWCGPPCRMTKGEQMQQKI